jgi:hypothetical protein
MDDGRVEGATVCLNKDYRIVFHSNHSTERMEEFNTDLSANNITPSTSIARAKTL